MFYHFKINKEKNGYWAECIELDGCVTQADTFDDLKNNMEEALNLYLNEPVTSKVTSQLPKKNIKGKDIVKVPVNPKIAFALNLKILRLKNGLTQKEIARMLGMKNIYSYQRLESPRNVNPSLSMLTKIKKIFPEFKIDDIFVVHKSHR